MTPNWKKDHKTELSECLTCGVKNLTFNDSCKCNAENIYLNRLKEQYYEVKRCLFPNEADCVRARYGGMREFCLYTQLVSFNDIEVMESEVNQSFI